MISATPTAILSNNSGGPLDMPLHDEEGNLVFLLQHLVDVTSKILGGRRDAA
jgi:hypothetical protein